MNNTYLGAKLQKKSKKYKKACPDLPKREDFLNFAPTKPQRTSDGEMAEWSIASVLKTDVLRSTGGSNPSLSAEKRACLLLLTRPLLKLDQLGLEPRIYVTTIGISLRTFRAIVNVCIDRKLIKGNTKEMFKDTGYNLMESRKEDFLDVATMRKLYDFWEKGEAKDENGKELFIPKEKNAIFRDLGLFLFMYLGDGQNLADTLRLEYDGWYFSTHGKQLRFLRHKTKDRNRDASEVIFPVTPEIQKILDRYANDPKLGERVFPIMSKFLSAEKETWVIQRYNKSIRKQMAKVAKMLNMEQTPTSTWTRHSFATNLSNTGVVPERYISDSMGHSSSGDITSKYIGAYPLKKMLEYNAYLLNEIEEEDDNKELNAADKKVNSLNY